VVTRIYLVNEPKGKHLVETKSASAAVKFVAQKLGITAKTAKARDLADAMKANVKINQYAPEDEDDDDATDPPADNDREPHPAGKQRVAA